MPHLYKFTAPEALDRCIRLPSLQRIFLAIIVRNRLIHLVCTAKAVDVLGLQSWNKILNLRTRNNGARGGGGEGAQIPGEIGKIVIAAGLKFS